MGDNPVAGSLCGWLLTDTFAFELNLNLLVYRIDLHYKLNSTLADGDTILRNLL
jgi:hypothetical protein